MIGPVLSFDLIRTSRRGWHHLLLWIYVGWLLLQVGVLFLYKSLGHFREIRAGYLPPEVFAGYARALVEQLIVQQFLLLFLVVPAFASGSISDEKTRGTLQEWLTTDLSAWEIVGGKLGAQIVQVGTLSLASLPLFGFFGVFAGMNLVALTALLFTIVVQLTALAAASILASVWCKRTTTAVFSVYVAGLLFYALAWRLGFDDCFHPLYLLKPAWLDPDDAQLGQRLLRMGLGWGTVLIVCLVLAIWRLRPAYRRQLASEGFRPGRLCEARYRPPVANNPLRWQERWLGDVPVPPLLRQLPRSVSVGAVSVATLAIGAAILLAHLPPGVTVTQVARLALSSDLDRLMAVWLRCPPSDEPFLLLSLASMALFTLGVGIRCAGAVSSERERKTWDMLLTTPMEPRHILRGKLWGIIDSARPYLLAYFIPAVLLAAGGGTLATIWVIFWWCVTWVMMYFMGATGIRCSARSQNSWRSLLAALLTNAWVIGLRFAVLGLPLGALGTGLSVTVLQAAILPPGSWMIAAPVAFVILSLGVTMFFLIAEAEHQLHNAEQWVQQYERISPLRLRAPRALRGARIVT